MSKTNNIIRKITNWKIIITIQLIASIALVGILFKLSILPTLYIVIVIAILLMFVLISYFLTKPSKTMNKEGLKKFFGKILSLLFSVILLIGTLYAAQGDSVINSITGANQQVTRFSVIVMKNSEYQSLSDLKNNFVELCETYDSNEDINKAMDALNKKESTISVKKVSDYSSLADDLYDGKTNAIFVNESYNGLFEEKHPAFDSETRIIWSFDIVEKMNDISKDVNVTRDVFNIYISGIDTSGPVSTVSRSDVNMLVTVNPKTKQILMTSIPRDYYVTLDNISQKDKLTHAGLDGVENSVKTIENFMDIDINYYARVNFTSLITMVDALGGIDVYSDLTFTPWTNSGIAIHEGINHMNGEMALAFARERYAYKSGDNHRVQNQQAVLAAMLDKAMSPAIITNYSKILKSIEGCFETNMASKDITALIQMQLSDMAKWNIMQIQLSGSGTMMTGGALMPNNRLYYMIPDQSSVDRASDLIKRMDSGETISIDE